MNEVIVRSAGGITLLGGGKARPGELREALRRAPCLVAVDGGAEFALAQGEIPQAVIGDMDSVPAHARAALPRETFHEVADQNSTDFDKALRSVQAPFVLGVGFLGRRVDHQLANFNVLARRATRACILIGKHDIVFAAPPRISLDLPIGSRVSLFPMAQVIGRSVGLHWPIDGLSMAADGKVGTSNHVAVAHDGPVALEFDGPGMLVILPRAALEAVIDALPGEGTHAPAR